MKHSSASTDISHTAVIYMNVSEKENMDLTHRQNDSINNFEFKLNVLPYGR